MTRKKNFKEGNSQIETFLIKCSQLDIQTLLTFAGASADFSQATGACKQCNVVIQFSKNPLAIKPRMFGKRYQILKRIAI